MRRRRGYLFKRGKIYYVRWEVGGKRFAKSTGKTNKREAEVEMNRIMEPFVAGDELTALKNLSARIDIQRSELERLQDERNPPLKLSDAWEAYYDSTNRPDSGEATLERYRSYIMAFTAWAEKNHPEILALRDVTPGIASEYAGHLGKRKLTGNTFNKHVGFLKLLFRVLEEPARIASNPWTRIQRKRIVSNSRRELTVDELKAVCSATSGEMRLLFALGIYTGLRMKDCALLRWAETDLKRGIILRIPSKTARRNPKPTRIPIHPVLNAMLREIKEREEYVLPCIAESYETNRHKLVRKIQQHFEKCGIKTVMKGTGKGTGKRAVVEVGFHSLRHSFISLCREADAPLSVVEAIVGHSSPAMTRHYSHVSDESSQKSVQALPAVFGDPQPLALPAVKLIEASKVHDLANELTSRNWKKIKGKLLAL